MAKRKTAHLILMATLLCSFGVISISVASAGSGTFYVVSTGPGDPEHITVKAIKTIKNADLVLCSPQSAKHLQETLQGKKWRIPGRNSGSTKVRCG